MDQKPRCSRRIPLTAVLCLCLSWSAGGADASGNAEAAGSFFQNQILPILVDNCYECHSHQSVRTRGNLLLDSRAGILTGGNSGPAMAPGSPDESLMIRAVRYTDPDLQMPPKGKKLSEAEVQLLVQWVEMGAPWPGSIDEESVRITGRSITDEDRQWWAFQPVQSVEPPALSDDLWVRNDIDRFVLKELHERGLSPASESERRALLRRAYFDLTGLPPTAEEVQAFLDDTSPEAYEKVIDRLLDSPRYGERWARHWLDLVRYAESDGYRQDAYRPDAWRYRDYVIRSFNENKPYNRFIMEQLAGDELAPNDPDVRVANGFLRLWVYEFNQRDVRGQWDAILNDITDVTADVFLGVGMSCARCHDHKFDPILQEDYFRLQAFLTPILPRDDIPLTTAQEWVEHQEKMARWERMTQDLRDQIEQIEKPHREAQGNTVFVKFPQEIKEMILKPPEERAPLEHQLAELAYRQLLFEYGQFQGRIKGEEKERWEALKRELAEFDRYKPQPLPRASLVSDAGPFAPPTYLPRGPRKPVAPGFLSVLTDEPAKVSPVPTAPNSTGRRTALAGWLANPENPLTARVMVNRLWHYHFGRGIAATPSDFGRLGEAPTHPELLDWLATEFIEGGWRLKEMHRLIMTSATYRQSVTHPEPDLARLQDAENRWLWRMNLRRLDAEQIRDAILAVSGELDLTAGGPSVQGSQPRRSIYTRVLRNQRDALLDAFDPPDSYTSVAQRNTTVTPMQSLLLMNGPWVLERAKHLAEEIRKTTATTTEQELVEQVYRRVLGRLPEPDELEHGLNFLRTQTLRAASLEADAPAALTDLCHVLLTANEFLYVE